jgi:hypothetical protein
VIGSWLAQGRDKPSPQRVRSVTDRWTKVFKEDRYRFRSLENPNALPTPLLTPKSSDLVAQLDYAQGLSPTTELLLYFLGHSASAGESDLRLILGIDSQGLDRTISLTWLLDTIQDHTPLRRLVVILDTCHAGRTRDAFRLVHETSFAMFATGDAYAFDAAFSDGLLRALEQPIQKNDQRIDRRASGITYRKIFEEARRRVLFGPQAPQDPKCFGGYGDTVLLQAPASVPRGFNPFASNRSVYGRVFCLLSIIRDTNPTLDELGHRVRKDDVFLLRREDGVGARYLSDSRLGEYLDFLRTAKWIVQPSGRFELTAAGLNACQRDDFNAFLLAAIETEVFEAKISFGFLDVIVKELLNDMIPPTPIRIKDRAGMKGRVLKLNRATRVAIQLLPSTGQFLKGAADAIFPCELGG